MLEAYLRWLRSKGRWAHNNLVEEYLRNFDLKDESIDRVGRELAAVADRFNTPWRERHRLFSLFTPHRAPGRIAVLALDAGSEVHSLLEEVGLIRDDLLYQGLGAEALREALQIHADRVSPKENLGKHFDCISSWVLRGDDFKFKTLRAEIATKLLIRWADDYSGEGDGLLSRTCKFLLHHYRDPRLHPASWHGVEEDAKAVIMRWLVKASLEQFLQIVDDIATYELKLQWPYRRAFWSAYERAGVITDAWVVFAGRGARSAKQVFRDKIPFGRFDKSGSVQPNHAVLLLRIGSLTIAEWSENSRCYIWLQGNERAPTLYKSEYAKGELRYGSDNGGVVHASSISGNWQQKVAGWIGQHTGIHISEIEYMPTQRRQ